MNYSWNPALGGGGVFEREDGLFEGRISTMNNFEGKRRHSAFWSVRPVEEGPDILTVGPVSKADRRYMMRPVITEGTETYAAYGTRALFTPEAQIVDGKWVYPKGLVQERKAYDLKVVPRKSAVYRQGKFVPVETRPLPGDFPPDIRPQTSPFPDAEGMGYFGQETQPTFWQTAASAIKEYAPQVREIAKALRRPKVRAAAVPTAPTPPVQPPVLVSTGPSMTTLLLIGGGVLAVGIAAILLLRK